MPAHFPLLSVVLFTPLAGAILLLFVNKHRVDAIRWIANVFGVLGFFVSLPLWYRFDLSDPGWQFVERARWIPSIGADYFLGVDGFSALMGLLTTLIGAIAILSSWTAITERVKEFYVCMLVLQTGMLGAFVSLDFLLFFLFWEVMLVPMYFLIGIWGSDRRIRSTRPTSKYRECKDTPIIMLTAINQVTNSRFSLDMEESCLPGVKDFLTKPVNFDELIKAVQKYI